MNEWKRIERVRTRYELRHTANIERSLRLQIMPVIKALEEKPPEEVIPQVVTLINEDPVRSAFGKMYADTGKMFARTTFMQVLGKGSKSEYDDIWMQEMLAFVEMKGGDRIMSITRNRLYPKGCP